MAERKFVIGSDCKTLLEEVIWKEIPITVTDKCDGNLRVYKSRFLALQPNRLVISLPVDQDNEEQMAPRAGQELAITFKKGYNKCLFVSRFISLTDFEREDGDSTAALVIYRPEQIEKVHRRAFERADVPSGEEVAFNFWLADRPGRKFQAVLQNISAGGLAAIIDTKDAGILKVGDQYDLQLPPLADQEPITGRVNLRHITPKPLGNRLLLGFQFVGLELSEPGRATLQRISSVVNVFQRRGKNTPSRQLVR